MSDLKNNNSSWYEGEHGVYEHFNTDYLWMYVVFAYLFTSLAMYLLVTETQRIIAIRQEYLGSQATVTDRTIRLSGIPPSLRSEEKIKNFIEHLQIGKVDKVMLCREWQELDDKMAERMTMLRKLEEAWTVFLGHGRVERSLESLPIVQPPPPVAVSYQDAGDDGDEESPLNRVSYGPLDPRLRTRPMLTLRSGPLGIHGRKVDAIDHYEEMLKDIDDVIRELRKKEYMPTSMAFVTLDSVAACVSLVPSQAEFAYANLMIANGCTSCTRSFADASHSPSKSCSIRCRLEKYISTPLEPDVSSLADHCCYHCSNGLLVSPLSATGDCA
jgi:hypothetical protein